MTTYTLTIGRRHKSQHATLADAIDTYNDLRDESGEGGSTWPDGRVTGGYRVSYNGRLWHGGKPVREYDSPGRIAFDARMAALS